MFLRHGVYIESTLYITDSNGAHQFFAKQVLDVVAKHDGAVWYNASFQLLTTHYEPSTDKFTFQSESLSK